MKTSSEVKSEGDNIRYQLGEDLNYNGEDRTAKIVFYEVKSEGDSIIYLYLEELYSKRLSFTRLMEFK